MPDVGTLPFDLSFFGFGSPRSLRAFESMFSGRRRWVSVPPSSYIALTAAASVNGSFAAGSGWPGTHERGMIPIDSYQDAFLTS